MPALAITIGVLQDIAAASSSGALMYLQIVVGDSHLIFYLEKQFKMPRMFSGGRSFYLYCGPATLVIRR